MACSRSQGGHHNLRRPLRYRTPSPPRDAVEPISPANPTTVSDIFLRASPRPADDNTFHWNGDNGSRSPFNVDGSPWQPFFLGRSDCARASSATPSHSGTQQQQQLLLHHQQQPQQQQSLSTHSRHTSMSNIDALATIALATSPTFTTLALDERASPNPSPRFRNASMPPPATINGTATVNANSNITPPATDSDERPCKRPRSDCDPTAAGVSNVSNDCELTAAATGSTFDSSMKTDAELLLNLARPNTTPLLQSSINKPILSPSQHSAEPAFGRSESLSDPSRLDSDVSPFTVSNNTQRRNTDQTHNPHNLKPDLSLSADANTTGFDGLNDIPYSKYARSAINSHKFDCSESSLVQGLGKHPSGELESHPSALASGHDHKSIHIQNHQNINFINDKKTHTNPDRSNKINPVDKSTHSHNTCTSDTFSTDIQTAQISESPTTATATTTTTTTKPRRRRQRKSAAPPPIQDIVCEADEDMEQQAKCAACKLWRINTHKPFEQDDVTWISCDGCNQWYHIVCAGFKNNREIRTVDRFICNTCRPSHGQTTFVRKSSRARTSIDYAGLNQGLIMAAKDTVDHHYIQPIKEGKISFFKDNFARLNPELITAEYFEHGSGMTEPIVIPAASNPRTPLTEVKTNSSRKENDQTPAGEAADQPRPDQSDNGPEVKAESLKESKAPFEEIYDCGQDQLGMVIPEGLTVRHIEKLYGSNEPVEVIDVKSQQGEDKKWTMGKWANYYYEQTPNKPVRNVISLEVSQTPLGRLIRRPNIVREFDLQDSVWPEELKAIGNYPQVQLYCLMSVKDSYTDFHIDFGGSSVYYHIIQGKKTFFFIPPREKHLKKYEEWCNSAAQDTTFLGQETEECYRVDLSAGDTMLIPSGWIHAVWTPEDSLVIGGNFLTRMSYGMQIKVSKIEKDTHVPRKFRYPHFQKIMWYTALKYLEDDPIPQHILQNFMDNEEYQFPRKYPIFHEFGPNRREDDKPGSDYYNVRYYSQPEVEGLQDLAKYLLRTALIAAGYQVDGITSDARNAVKKSIPRCPWEPMEAIRRFGFWVAWKRGNEPAPQWTKANAFDTLAKIDTFSKKVSKPGRRSQRNNSSSSNNNEIVAPNAEVPESQSIPPETEAPPPPANDNDNQVSNEPTVPPLPPQQPPIPQVSVPDPSVQQSSVQQPSVQQPSIQEPSVPQPVPQSSLPQHLMSSLPPPPAPSSEPQQPPATETTMPVPTPVVPDAAEQNLKRKRKSPSSAGQQQGNTSTGSKPRPRGSGLGPKRVACEPCRRRRIRCRHKDDPFNLENRAFGQPFADHLGLVNMGLAGVTDMYTMDGVLAGLNNPVGDAMLPGVAGSTSIKKGRSKACDECRRSKRRCIHDEHGRIDPIKAQEKSRPRASTLAKQRSAAIEEFNNMKQMFRKQIPIQGMEHHLMSPEMTARAALGLAGTLEVPPQNQQQMYASPPSVKAEMDSNAQQPAATTEGSHLGVARVISPPTSLADDTDTNASELASMNQRLSTFNQQPSVQQTSQPQPPPPPPQATVTSTPAVDVNPVPPADVSTQETPDAVASAYPDPTPFSHHSENASLLIQQPGNFLSKRVSSRPSSSSSFSSSSHHGNSKGPASSPRRSRINRPSLSNADTDPDSLRLIRELQEQDFGLRRRRS